MFSRETSSHIRFIFLSGERGVDKHTYKKLLVSIHYTVTDSLSWLSADTDRTVANKLSFYVIIDDIFSI